MSHAEPAARGSARVRHIETCADDRYRLNRDMSHDLRESPVDPLYDMIGP